MLYDAELRTSCDRSPIVITLIPMDVAIVKPVSVPSELVMLALVPDAQSDDAVTTRFTQFTAVGASVGVNVGFKLRVGTTVGISVTEGIGDGKGDRKSTRLNSSHT